MKGHFLAFGLGVMLLALTFPCVLAPWYPVANGSFESGTVGLVPDDWVMIANNVTDPPDAPKTATYIHEMQQTDQRYFEGGRSLWLHSRVIDEGLRIGRGSDTFAETKDWINAPWATHVRIYMRDIVSTHSLGWGWSNWIFLRINDVDVAWTYYGGQYWGGIFAHGEFLNFNYYNYTASGADGATWYVYEYSIPESVDKSHMKIQIGNHAWDWTFYDTSYFADLEFVVDKVELLSPQNSPYSKPSYPDYVPSGVPDFDQKQNNWIHHIAGWTWCGPVAAANSLWWLDSEYESIMNQHPVPPPTISDSFNLLSAYGAWDDHDVKNVEPFVNSLASFMDTDGIRTGIPHSGTYFKDLQAGLSQYMARLGINPAGDCDGDGDVDMDDAIIIGQAMGSTPGSSKWNMAADVFKDNKVDVKDLILVASNYGQVGMFYEHTEEFPELPWIAEEVYKCEDVVVLLEFWQDLGGGNWNRYVYDPGGQGGHYVTVAGLNAQAGQLVISDPWWDAFESGAVPGESPVPHPYPHLPDVHNDTQFVSHDAYVAAPWFLPSPSPYPGKSIWELIGYMQAMGFDATWHAFLRAAVVTSPLTVAVLDTTNSKDPCTPKLTVGRTFPVNVSAIVTNKGQVSSSFSVTAYANGTALGTTTVANLPPGANTTVKVATWNTTGWAYGDYYLTAGTNASYQAFTSNKPVRLTIPGDLNGDWTVDIFDAILFANAMTNTVPGDPNWSPNADLKGDGIVDIFDAIVLSNHYNKIIPPP